MAEIYDFRTRKRIEPESAGRLPKSSVQNRATQAAHTLNAMGVAAFDARDTLAQALNTGLATNAGEVLLNLNPYLDAIDEGLNKVFALLKEPRQG